MASISLRDYWIGTYRNNPELHESQRLYTDEPIVTIRIARNYQPQMTDSGLYETTRRYWRASDRIQRAQYAIAVYERVCIEAYEVHNWRRVPFEGSTRWEFDGVVANDDIRSQFLFKSVRHIFRPGAANPITYRNC